MSETKTTETVPAIVTTTIETNDPAKTIVTPVITGRGLVQKTIVAPPVEVETTTIETPDTTAEVREETDGAGATETTTTTGTENKDGDTETKETVTETPPKQTSDEDLIKMLSERGINTESLDSLKKMTAPAVDAEAEKKKAELLKDKQRLDLFVANGGTIDEYSFLKATASADAAQLSEEEYKKELKAAKFTDEEIDAIMKEHRVDEAELEQYEDESEKEFLKRKKDFLAKKLASGASNTIQQAKSILEGLDNAITSASEQQQQEKEFGDKVEEYFSAAPRSLTFSIGKINGVDVPPIEMNVADKDIAEIKDILKDPAKRKQYFFKDKTLNLQKVADVMLRNKILESVLRTAYETSGKRQVAEFQKTFPAHSAHAVGVGGAPNKIVRDKGEITQRGDIQRVRQLN